IWRPGRNRRLVPGTNVVFAEVQMLYLAEGIPIPDALVELLGTPQPVGAGAKLGGPDRRTGRPSPGEDLDHAIRRFGTVQRRRRGTLQHLDRRDVVGVDVVDSGRGVPTALEADGVRTRGIVGSDTIDEDDRLRAQTEGTDAANPCDPARPELAAGALDLQAGNRGGERFEDGVAGGRLLCRRHVEDAHVVTERPHFGVAGLAAHD